MKKALIATALLFTALPFTFDGVTPAVSKADARIGELKQKIKALKVQRREALEAKDKKKATIFKRRISRLKKKTRRAAA